MSDCLHNFQGQFRHFEGLCDVLASGTDSRSCCVSSVCSFLLLLLSLQNWSSPLQETSSMPWRRLALTSCWGGKVATLLWACSQSARRRAPRFLGSRPRGGDWSGLCFDTRFSCAGFMSSPSGWTQDEPSLTVLVAFSVWIYICLLPSLR